MKNAIKGSCLCGKITFEVAGPFDNFYFCHCSRCQKATGSAHAANIFGKLDSIAWISGKSYIKSYELEESEYFNKSFCSECGSPVPRRAKSGEFLIIPAGALNSDSKIEPLHNIFWSDRAPWYDEGCLAEKVDGYPNS